MIRYLAGLAMLATASSGAAATSPTDFGIRTVSGPSFRQAAGAGGAVDVAAAVSLASSWGRVTSTYRSPQHNRRVGGVRNSYHLRGRAIDIARRPGVRHAAIEAAYRRAGYTLVESLDEGDHSHFAFGAPASFSPVAKGRSEATRWRVVTVASVMSR